MCGALQSGVCLLLLISVFSTATFGSSALRHLLINHNQRETKPVNTCRLRAEGSQVRPRQDGDGGVGGGGVDGEDSPPLSLSPRSH